MEICSEIRLLKNLPGIEVEYCENELKKTDNTGIRLYEKYKISILLSSGMLVIHNNTATRTERGDVLVFRPDELHSARVLEDGIYKYVNIFIPVGYFDALCMDTAEIVEFLEHRGKKNHFRQPANKKERLLSLLMPVVKRVKENSFGSIHDFYGLLGLLLFLAKAYRKNEIGTEDRLPPAVEKALRYLSEHYGEKIVLKVVAENSYCSVTYLSRVFKQYMGCTVCEQLVQYRIINAKRLLKEGKTVTEACYHCGFNDCSYFIKVFKELNGITPYEYKKTIG